MKSAFKNSDRSRLTLSFFFWLILLPLSLAAAEPVTYTTSPLHIKTDDANLRFTVEEALTPPQLENGLMMRTSLPEMHGMIFLFPDARKVSFWMKNTLIPLDMLFVSNDGVITQIAKNATPESTQLIPSTYDTRAVIELMGGSAARYHITEGNKVMYSRLQ